MSDQNTFFCTGRLGADPEERRFPSGDPVVNFRMAISETWRSKETGERKEATLWMPVTITNSGLCKVASAYLKKGSRIAVTGTLKSRSYNKDGHEVFVTELHLTPFQGSLTMLDGRQDGDDSREAEPRQRYSSDKTRRQASQAPSFDPTGDDDSIPFHPEFR